MNTNRITMALCAAMLTTVTFAPKCAIAEDELDKCFAHSAEAVDYMRNVMFYAHGFDKQPTADFLVGWNENGAFTKPSDAVPFGANGTFRSKFDENGKWDYTKTIPAVWRMRMRLGDYDEKGEGTKWIVMSKKLDKDPNGIVWLSNFSVYMDGEDGKKSVQVKVFVNDRVVIEKIQPNYDKTLMLEEKLGALKAGDSVSVCYAPGNKESVKAIVRFGWVLEDLAEGVKPKYAFNIAHPPVNLPNPPLWENGLGGPYYMGHWAVEEQNKRLREANPEVVWIGDSITACWDDDKFKEVRQKMLLANYRVATLGFSGDWINNVLFRLYVADYDKYPIKAFVVMIGTNNISNGYSNDEIIEGNKAVIEMIKRRCPGAKILLCGIFPRDSRKGWGVNVRIDRINEGLAKLADGDKVQFMNLRDLFFHENGELRRDRLVDGLHPSPAGSEAWAAAVNPTIFKMLGR